MLHDEARRCVAFIDTAYEFKCRLALSLASAVELDELFQPLLRAAYLQVWLTQAYNVGVLGLKVLLHVCFPLITDCLVTGRKAGLGTSGLVCIAEPC
eukprot:1145289-Pelagomonas_calceolata.AAC.1